jgi:hypothetical protein
VILVDELYEHTFTEKKEQEKKRKKLLGQRSKIMSMQLNDEDEARVILNL